MIRYFDKKLTTMIDRHYRDELTNEEKFDLTYELTMAITEQLPLFLSESFGLRVDTEIVVDSCSEDINCDQHGNSYDPLRNYWIKITGEYKGVEAKTIGIETQEFLINQGINKEDAEYIPLHVALS